MIDLKSLAIVLSAASGIQNLVSSSRGSNLTTILFHDFFFERESKSAGITRLRRQLEWLRSCYTPLSLNEAISALETGELPERPVLVTIDDARRDLLEAQAEFEAFEVPIAVFVCAGWSAQAGALEKDSLLARVVSAIEWYSGSDAVIQLEGGNKALHVNPANRAATIEHILASPEEYLPYLEELAIRLHQLDASNGGRRICSWSELIGMQRDGVQFGCHSVSHIRLASASGRRIAFEISEAKRLIDKKLGTCAVFAYPYGVEGTFSKETTGNLKKAGFIRAFLTHAEFANSKTDPYHLPRIALPNRAMSLLEFQARVMGGQIPLRKAKCITRLRRSDIQI